MSKVKLAIAGVGNCCQAFLEGIEYYRQHPEDTHGLMNVEIAGYKVTDIVPVAAQPVEDRLGHPLPCFGLETRLDRFLKVTC